MFLVAALQTLHAVSVAQELSPPHAPSWRHTVLHHKFQKKRMETLTLTSSYPYQAPDKHRLSSRDTDLPALGTDLHNIPSEVPYWCIQIFPYTNHFLGKYQFDFRLFPNTPSHPWSDTESNTGNP